MILRCIYNLKIIYQTIFFLTLCHCWCHLRNVCLPHSQHNTRVYNQGLVVVVTPTGFSHHVSHGSPPLLMELGGFLPHHSQWTKKIPNKIYKTHMDIPILWVNTLTEVVLINPVQYRTKLIMKVKLTVLQYCARYSTRLCKFRLNFIGSSNENNAQAILMLA